MARVRQRKVAEQVPAEIVPAITSAPKTVVDVDDEMRIIAKYKDRIRNPLTAIRSHCVECMGGAPQSVAECVSEGCSLWALRMGKNAYDARVVKRNSE
jgi:hypothetical protein